MLETVIVSIAIAICFIAAIIGVLYENEIGPFKKSVTEEQTETVKSETGKPNTSPEHKHHS